MLREMVDDEVTVRFDRLFQWFALDALSLRAFMRTHHVFIGGSLPLTILAPRPFTPRNADLYVSLSNRNALVQHLVHEQGFQVEKFSLVVNPVTLPTHPLAYDAIHTYGAGVLCTTVLQRDIIVVSVRAHADHALPGLHPKLIGFSWTTALFNYVTADAVACAYPALTLKGRALFHMARFMALPGDNSHHLLQDYADRGLQFAGHPIWWFERDDDKCRRGLSCPFTIRHFADRGTLVLPHGEPNVHVRGRGWIFGGLSERAHEV